MKFLDRKRRQAPAVIIISLIDILIVLLIFMMVTTTFRQQPAVRLALPESAQPREGASTAGLVVTVGSQEPFLYFGTRPVTPEGLQQELAASKARNPGVSLSMRIDRNAPFGEVVKVLDAAKAANIKVANALVKRTGSP